MNYIDLPDAAPPPPVAEQIALNEISHLNAAVARRAGEHMQRFPAFWDDRRATPDAILEAMGNKALPWLASASESAGHIERLAAIVGKTLDDFIPAELYVPRREFIPHQDGTVTLAPPAEGFDAWGSPIPVEPES